MRVRNKITAQKRKSLSSTTCNLCGERIPVEAKKCSHCGHFQKGWLRKINISFPVFSLIFASAALFISAFNVFEPFFEKKYSDLKFIVRWSRWGEIKLTIWNEGNTSAFINSADLYLESNSEGFFRLIYSHKIYPGQLIVPPKDLKEISINLASKEEWSTLLNKGESTYIDSDKEVYINSWYQSDRSRPYRSEKKELITGLKTYKISIKCITVNGIQKVYDLTDLKRKDFAYFTMIEHDWNLEWSLNLWFITCYLDAIDVYSNDIVMIHEDPGYVEW